MADGDAIRQIVDFVDALGSRARLIGITGALSGGATRDGADLVVRVALTPL